MKLIGWQNGRCGGVWRGVAIKRGRDRGLPRKQPTEGQMTPESSFKVSHQPFTRQHHRAYKMSAVCVRIYRPQDSE